MFGKVTHLDVEIMLVVNCSGESLTLSQMR